MGDYELELDAAISSFRYGAARPEFCCRLGFNFLQKNDMVSAIFWYKLAYLHNEIAFHYRPEDLKIINNKRCLEAIWGIDAVE
ncbi:hypothetical protein P0092_06505 [Ruminiclostridium papyrosolvens DSM 2782]|uniref:hypothetical protein n=1 Tax=Ruminiclostridium papyrosolvens TaxID=29362 RepID=UPI0023E461A0|nr:hypothetical protein [Ruminiclostridium papyrosolvens]WES35623.1 hypothetical protein P0092_06505 [Ruminiclostridium papyrosolvens DSM 2782]